jgi:hypothetical protein
MSHSTAPPCRRNTGSGTLELAWLSQSGRVASKCCTVADGFRAKLPYASVAVVAECARDDHDCAAAAAAAIRDTFSEGVAHGTGEALRDAFDRVSDAWRQAGHTGCSAAATAAMGSEAWIAVIGSCHAFMAERGSDGSIDIHPQDPDLPREEERTSVFRMRRINLREGQSIVLATHGLRKLMGSSAAAKYTSGCREALPSCLRTLVRETRIQFRKKGGAVAAVRLGFDHPARPFRKAAVLLLSALAVSSGILFLAGLFDGSGPAGQSDSIPGPAQNPVIMPLEPQTSPESLGAAQSQDTVRVLFIPSIEPSLAGIGTQFGVSSGSVPDDRWENAPRGVYYLESDSNSASMALQMAESGAPSLPAVPVRTIMNVRQDGAAAFSAWLRTVPSQEASASVVIVEAGSSVAGGAAWIRNFAVFANGSRDMKNLPSCFTGDSLSGLPARRNPSCYSVIVILQSPSGAPAV